jgi:putative transposase
MVESALWRGFIHLFWYALLQVIVLIFDVLHLSTRSAYDKDLEILILRRQLAILQRHNQRVVRPDRDDKVILAFLTKQFKHIKQMTTKQLRDVIFIVQPDTVLRWHRDLVRRKWAQKHSSSGGRPPIKSEIEQLILRFVRENDWGYGKIVGELRKLGHQVSDQTIANILKRHGIPPLPERKTSLSWQHLMTHYKDQLLACDFFTVETLFLQTLYVFFFIEIGTRRVHFAGCTPHPTQAWVTQQARQLTWILDEENINMRFLIRDRDTKFSSSFDAVFNSEHIHIIQTPFQAPKANAFAERWVRSVRNECLDKIIIFNQAHLNQIMREYIDYYNTQRPHQGISQKTPIPFLAQHDGRIQCQKVLGGIIHSYYREAG